MKFLFSMSKIRKAISGTALLILFSILIVACNPSFKAWMPGKNISPKKMVYQDTLPENPTRLEENYDVTYYDLDMSVDVENRDIWGKVEMRFKAIHKLDSIEFNLFQNLAMTSVTQNGRSLPFSRKGNSVKADLFRDISAGQKGTITIQYSGKPIVSVLPPWAGGFVWKKDRSGYPHIGVVSDGIGASSWWPCKDHPSDEPDSMAIHITCPSHLVAVSNGKLTGKQTPRFGKARYSWFVSNPINPTGVSINIGNFVILTDTMQYPDLVRTMNHYVLPENYDKAKKHFTQAKDIIRVYESLYGPYPFWSDGYKLVEAPYVGMDHQSAIAYGNGFSNSSNYHTFGLADYIILHETAHEWWGNSVTVSSGRHNWIHEGFATYSEVLFIERKMGYPRSLDYLSNIKKRIQNRRALTGPIVSDLRNWRDSDDYMKGCWILHTFRNVLKNDEVFFDILKTFSTSNRFKQVTTIDFTNLVKAKTGQDYEWLFDQFLNQPTPPELQYYFEKGRLWYRWTNCRLDFQMPFEFKAGNKKIRIYPSTDIDQLYVNNAIRVFPNENEFLANAQWVPELKMLSGMASSQKEFQQKRN